MTHIIGVNGFKTSGKDTVYSIIAKHMPGAVRVAFADKLKLMAALALGLEGPDAALIEQMNKAKESWMIHLTDSSPFDGDCDMVFHELSGREYLQHFGNHARRVFGDTFWIDQVLPNPQRYHEEDKSDRLNELVEEAYPGVKLLVVTDARYPNEAARVRELGGEMWEVVRPGLSSDGHASEMPLPRELIDKVIMNDGSLADLESKVKEALEC